MKLTLPLNERRFSRHIIHADTSDPDRFTVQTQEETDRLITYCRQREEDLRHAKRDGLFHVAEVPLFVYEQAVQEGWVDDQAAWRRWLNDPANACFRTWKGRV